MKKNLLLLLLITHGSIHSDKKALTTQELNDCLFSGVTNSCLLTVQHFLQLGAQVNCPAEKTTPLMRAAFLASQKTTNVAAKQEAINIVRTLIQAGADTTEFNQKYAHADIFKK